MASRTIASPGVQITEQDLSIITRPIGSTDVLITGFAPQGPTEDLVNVSDITEFEQIYGTPTNSAERYLFHSAKQILNTSPANLLVSRLPYGSGMGDGYTNKYSALVYPITGAYREVTDIVSYTLSGTATFNGIDEANLLTGLSTLGSTFSLYTTTTAAQNANIFKTTGAQVATTTPTNVTTNVYNQSLTGVDQADVISKTWNLSSTLIALNANMNNFLYLWDLNAEDVGSVTSDFWDASPITTDGLNFSRTLRIAYSSIENIPTSYSITVSTLNTNVTKYEGLTAVSTLTASNTYEVLEPISVLLTQDQYDKLVSNEIDWKNELVFIDKNDGFDIIKNAGMVIINTSKTSINDIFEGYYIGICDNSNINPATDFDALTAIKSTQSQAVANDVQYQPFVNVPESRFNFKLTEAFNGFTGNSLSESIESFPTGYDFGTTAFEDSIVLGLYKIKTSIYNQDTVTLDYRLVEGYSGSLYSKRTQNNPSFGVPNSYFLESIVDKKSNNIKVIVNPFLSTLGTWTTNTGMPAKRVRVNTSAKCLYPSGAYTSIGTQETNDLGNVPLKLQRVLNQIQNNDTINIDVVAECGLGTIWVGAKSKKENDNISEYIFDDSYSVDMTDMKNTTGDIVAGINSDYSVIASKFLTFVTDRKDHVFIADPLRYIFVQGKNFKTQSKRSSYVFSNDIYWPLKNQFAAFQSSYMATYGNWLQTFDDISDSYVWVPASGYAASVFASTSQIAFPWAAPAGLNRGTLINVMDLGVTPNQKQCDLLYKINVNPINFFGNDGYAIFGQKTLYRKPSAFDRINVRRLFLTLEKETKQLLKYYVFEPNTFTTRQRLIGSLQPTFDRAKVNDGLYEYQIICDERNNTPDVIDNNELKISIYIKPVRTAEFILADFIGTRTGVSFSELIG